MENAKKEIIKHVKERQVKFVKLGAITGVPKHIKPQRMNEARAWLRYNEICKYYCSLLDLCHDTMINRLEKQWGKL